MYIIHIGLFLITHQFLFREAHSALLTNEIPDSKDTIDTEKIETELQERQNAILLQQQQQQQMKQNSINQQQIPLQQRNRMIEQHAAMQQRNMIAQQPQISPQQMALQENSVIQQNQYKQNAFPMGQPYQIPRQMVPLQPAPTPKSVELIIRKEETEAEKSEKANEVFERLLQFMTLMGQVDTYLSEKAHSAIKTIARIADDKNEKEDMFN